MLPSVCACIRPICRNEEQIVIVFYVSAPCREAEVVADYHRNIPASISDYWRTAISGVEQFFFRTEREKVLFVVKSIITTGFYEESSIKYSICYFTEKTSGYSETEFVCILVQFLQCFSAYRFCRI